MHRYPSDTLLRNLAVMLIIYWSACLFLLSLLNGMLLDLKTSYMLSVLPVYMSVYCS